MWRAGEKIMRRSVGEIHGIGNLPPNTSRNGTLAGDRDFPLWGRIFPSLFHRFHRSAGLQSFQKLPGFLKAGCPAVANPIRSGDGNPAIANRKPTIVISFSLASPRRLFILHPVHEGIGPPYRLFASPSPLLRGGTAAAVQRPVGCGLRKRTAGSRSLHRAGCSGPLRSDVRRNGHARLPFFIGRALRCPRRSRRPRVQLPLPCGGYRIRFDCRILCLRTCRRLRRPLPRTSPHDPFSARPYSYRITPATVHV